MARKLPKLCRHKASGRAYVTDPFTGKEHFLGVWGSPEAQAGYEEWIKQLLARRSEVASGAPPGSAVTVARLVVDYLTHAREYYRKGGKITSEVAALENALTPVNELFGTRPADAFGPSELKAVRDWMVQASWARRNINKQVQRIRRVWRWGVEHELVKTETLAALEAVAGLRRGRTPAAETAPVEPVDPAVVAATLPRLRADVRALVEVQLYGGMRPGEAVIMRPCDVDRSVEPWLYVPYTHKTEHHGRQKRIWLGPKARAALAPLLLKCPAPDAWVFPSRARGRHSSTRTHWTVAGYRRAIERACEQDPPLPVWHPNQLRHRALTYAREVAGLEAAQAVGGHAQIETTQVYAERLEKLARRVAEDIG